ncbi:hypothetical protein F4810DRAFT_464401 [Camillea tinctor]|nr:hypothetical protein F4810DRAFT_464401 [Camillea tinctor]
MDPASDSPSRAGQHRNKRRASLAGFISKILPTNRPEQGGTWRPNEIDDHDSAYEDLGINPNELTDWNFATDRPPKLGPATVPNTPTRQGKRRSRTPQQKASPTPLNDNGKSIEGIRQQKPHPRMSHGPGAPSLPVQGSSVTPQFRRSHTMTRAEISNLLKLKEESRRSRRNLKESGDWLGVQGADPYSGEFSVLTPTSTLSSDTASLSTKNKLADLEQKKREAKLAYEKITLLEEEEKAKAKQEKQLSKLGKIERAKKDLRQQHDFVRWSQHKRQWSSAAEPNLSPIAQSLSNMTGSNASDIVGQPSASHLLQSPTDAPRVPSHEADPPHSENSQPKPQESLPDQSTDTVIRKSSDLQSDQNVSPLPPHIRIHPPSISLGRGINLNRPKAEKSFLWRRRRRIMEPGGLVRSLDTSLASNLPKHPPTDPLADVKIPDYHISLTPLEMPGESSSQTASSGDSLASSSTQTAQRTTDENSTALSVKTNLPEQDQAHESANKATVTSSQSKLKGSMKPLSIPRRLARSRFSIAQAKDSQKKQKKNPGKGQSQDHHHQDLSPGDTQESQKEPPLANLQSKGINPEEVDKVLPQMHFRIETLQRESVFTPITTTTGYAPDPQNQHSSRPPQPMAQTDQVAQAISTTEDQVTPEPLAERIPYTASNPMKTISRLAVS